jgi:glycosyltransferase involved in cell wall biosynthesis
VALGPIPLGGEPVLVLCFDPLLDDLISVTDPGASVFVTDGPQPAIGGLEPDGVISFSDLLGPRVDPRVRAVAPRHVIVHSLYGARVVGILAALRCGGRVFHLVDAPGSYFTVNRRGAMALSAGRGVRRRLARAPGARALERLLWMRIDPGFPTLASSLLAADGAEARGFAARPLPADGPLRVVHAIGGLGPGGAERQLTYVAAAQRRAGHSVRALTLYPTTGDEAHYVPALRRAGVPCAALPRHPWGQRMPPSGLDETLALAFERHYDRQTLIPFAVDLIEAPPDVLHCWLDTTNALGGVAALAVGVPRVVLSTRNVSPRHMPRLDRPYLRETYAALARSQRVRLVANSHAGAADYAEWLGIDPGRFTVIHNGIDCSRLEPAGEARRAEVRRELGVSPDAFLVVGAFRLAPEKAPFEFLEVLARARKRIPNLAAVHMGVGPLAAEVRLRAAELGLGDVLRFLGRRSDPHSVMAAADVSALTSRHEGCPNVVLESQALEVPAVVTRAGGAPETVDEGRTGYVVDVGDVDAFFDMLEALATAPGLRVRLGKAGREWVSERFSLERMASQTMDLYRA